MENTNLRKMLNEKKSHVSHQPKPLPQPGPPSILQPDFKIPQQQRKQHKQRDKHITKFSDSWNCHLCENVVSTSQLLEAHMRNKHGQEKATDVSSQFRFSSLSNCDTCEEVFSTPELLKEHKQNTHNQDEEMVEINEQSKESDERNMDTEDKDIKINLNVTYQKMKFKL